MILLQFKLTLKGEHVGYETHEVDEYCNECRISHQYADHFVWFDIVKFPDRYIKHDGKEAMSINEAEIDTTRIGDQLGLWDRWVEDAR